MRRFILFAMATLSALAATAQPMLNRDNIDEILAELTLEEKAALCVGGGWGSMMAGSLTASDAVLVPGAAGTTRAIPRLGIPQTVLADGPAGLRIEPRREGTEDTFFCTGFPVGTVLASMWNTELVEQLTTAMGEEVKEYGVDVLLAPGQNLHRNPLCGRNFEYFSEDPLLCGKTSAAYVRGIQSNGVGVSVKHFAFNNQEVNRLLNDARINPRAIRELYLKGFEITVREADPWTIMSSYNGINGVFTQQSRELLTDILRDEWGFRGIVMTDWGFKDGTVDAVRAGNDLMEPGMDPEIERIINGVNDGTIPQEDLDRNVRHILEYIVRTPRFAGYKYSNKPDLAAHAELVRKATPEGLILLENNGVLPIEAPAKIALYGVGSYDFIAGGTGSGNVNKAYIRNIAVGLRENGFELDPDIEKMYTDYIPQIKEDLKNNPVGNAILLGDPVAPEMVITRDFMAKKVEETDLAVFTISRNAGEGDDRKAEEGDWTLSAIERSTLQNLADLYHLAGKKLVVVLNIGGVIETQSWKHIPDAILLAWTPGQEGGYAVADVLSGAANPSGKLPMTFPVSYFDIPSSHNFPHHYHGKPSVGDFASVLNANENPEAGVDYTEYAEGIWVGYRYFVTSGKRVSYPFGYGLSYTQFEYSDPVIRVAAGGAITASVVVTNVGDVAGKEAVQLYIGAPDGGLVKPEYELKAFTKTKELQPGESETVTMKIDPYTLASFNEETSAWELAPGVYRACFGASSADIRVKSYFKENEKSWPVHKALLPKTPISEITVR